MKTQIDYTQQSKDFLYSTNTTFKAEFLRHAKYFMDDIQARDIYIITLTRGSRSFSFEFGQSINNSGKFWCFGKYEKGVSHGIGKYKTKPYPISEWDININFKSPTEYDVLACLTKFEVGSFNDFCVDFGYNVDSRKAEKIYQAVLNEYNNVKMLWSDKEIELLQEIQ